MVIHITSSKTDQYREGASLVIAPSNKTDQYREGASLVIAPSSKTDQYREGASLVIARTGAATCPISMMQRYFSMGQLVHDSQNYLFGEAFSSHRPLIN